MVIVSNIFFYYNFFIYKVFVVVGNKSDLYEHAEVTNQEGLNLANQMKAIFQITSAKNDVGGIDELFKNIGKKILDPNAELTTNITKEEYKKKGEKLLREKIRNESKAQKKGGCC